MDLDEKVKSALKLILKDASSYDVFHVQKLADKNNTASIVDDTYEAYFNDDFMQYAYYAEHVDSILQFLISEGFADMVERGVLRFTPRGRELKEAGGIDEFNKARRKANWGRKVWGSLNKWIAVLVAVTTIGGSIATVRSCQLSANDKENKHTIDSLNSKYGELKKLYDSLEVASAKKDSTRVMDEAIKEFKKRK